jgi:methylated-DNA-protein-cysteine methyltransferase related protein
MARETNDEGLGRWRGAVLDDRQRDRRGAVLHDRRAAVLERVRATPPGFVRTYGDVSPGAPRFAGTVLHGCDDPELPWFRIVRADGSLAKGARQRALLEAEGVPFRGARVDMRAARLP